MIKDGPAHHGQNSTYLVCARPLRDVTSAETWLRLMSPAQSSATGHGCTTIGLEAATILAYIRAVNSQGREPLL